jgi:hypothetical protein
MVNHVFDVGEQDFCDFAVVAQNFDGGFAKRHGAAQVVNFPAKASTVVGHDLHIFAIEHSLQFFHQRKKVIHGFSFLLTL